MDEQNNQNFENNDTKEVVKTITAPDAKKAAPKMTIMLGAIAAAVVVIVVVLVLLLGGKDNGGTNSGNNNEIGDNGNNSVGDNNNESNQPGNPSHTHAFGEWETVKDATCSDEGSKARYCQCGECQTRTISKLGHEWENATCTQPKTCNICDEISGMALGHSWTFATCTSAKKCSTCDETEGDPLPHSIIESVVVKATSISSGTINKKCENCTYEIEESYNLVPYTSEEIYDIAKESVAEVLTYDKSNRGLSLGTAFVISEDGKLLTNYHVIEDAYSAKVTIGDVQYDVKHVLAYDKDIDLAVLKINATGLTPLYIQTEGIKGGATVYAVGSSEGYTLSFSSGVIASPSRTFYGVEYIQHEAAISHGNSGGPLFNVYGEVIGINTLTNIDGQNLNFAISCSEINNLVYGEKLTMAQLYEKECNVFVKIKNYVIKNGEYDAEDNDYSLLLDSTYSDGYTYRRSVNYDVSDNELSFSIMVNTSYYVAFVVDSDISGSYFWCYFDDYNYEMYGTLYASTFTSSTLLGYSYNNVSSSSLRASVRKLASSLMSLLITGLEIDLGIEASDLGFFSY